MLDSPRLNFDDAPLWLGLGFTLLQDFRLGIQGIAGKYRIREGDVVPAQVKTVLAHVGNTEPGNNSQGEPAVNQALAEFGLLTVFVVKMNLIGVTGQQSEPGIIRLGHRPPQATAIDIPDFKVFVASSFPARFDRHKNLLT